MTYIAKKHHASCAQMLPLVANRIQSAIRNEKRRISTIRSIHMYFTDLSMLLEQHLRKENHIFFPFVHKMLELNHGHKHPSVPQFPLIENPLHILKTEHKQIKVLMRRIKNESGDFSVTPRSSAVLQLCYGGLRELDHELRKMIDIEAKVLFPKVLQLEQTIKKQPAKRKSP